MRDATRAFTATTALLRGRSSSVGATASAIDDDDDDDDDDDETFAASEPKECFFLGVVAAACLDAGWCGLRRQRRPPKKHDTSFSCAAPPTGTTARLRCRT